MNRPLLEERLGYRFGRRELLAQALTHRSYGTPHNERLEFLGDSVLGFVIARELYARFESQPEGKLSRLRATLVREQTLAELARSIGLGEFVSLGEGELKSGGAERPSILADALEALFGAVLLDGGAEAAAAVILGLYAARLDEIDPRQETKDPKTRLQEYLQARRMKVPAYRVAATRGVAPNEEFEVECRIEALGLAATGAGSTRRRAEQEAARRAYDLMTRSGE
jgi:ribonuclease-3